MEELQKIRKNSDYYPFGMTMPGRTFNSGEYRYGFNGIEKDDEVKGEGSSLDFGSRIYDSRLGRWLSVDLKAAKYAAESPYGFAFNNPIYYVDPDGENPHEGGREISINFTTFRVVNAEDNRGFGNKILDKSLNAKALKEWAATEATVTAITRGSEWLKQGLLLLDPDLRDQYKTAEDFINAAHDDEYSLRELQWSEGNLDLSQPSTVNDRTVKNLGRGFEAEVTDKREYSATYDSEGKASLILKSVTSYELVDNPYKCIISDDKLSQNGHPTTDKIWETATNTYDKSGNLTSSETSFSAATSRPENADD